jgi:hypothetical protein
LVCAEFDEFKGLSACWTIQSIFRRISTCQPETVMRGEARRCSFSPASLT